MTTPMLQAVSNPPPTVRSRGPCRPYIDFVFHLEPRLTVLLRRAIYSVHITPSPFSWDFKASTCSCRTCLARASGIRARPDCHPAMVLLWTAITTDSCWTVNPASFRRRLNSRGVMSSPLHLPIYCDGSTALLIPSGGRNTRSSRRARVSIVGSFIPHPSFRPGNAGR